MKELYQSIQSDWDPLAPLASYSMGLEKVTSEKLIGPSAMLQRHQGQRETLLVQRFDLTSAALHGILGAFHYVN